MKLSVIVPLYHPYYLDDILDSYASQEHIGKDNYEVLFMVTGKDQSLCSKVEKKAGEGGFPWRAIPMVGMSNCVSRNLGAREATGDVLLFIDGDQLIAPNLFCSHLKAYKHADDNVVGMGICNINVIRYPQGFDVLLPTRPHQVYTDKMRVMGDCLTFVKRLKTSQAIGLAGWHNMDDFTDYINVVGRNISVSKKWFERIGMWDESLSYSETTKSRGWEDLEFGLRGHDNDMNFKMVPSWTVHMEHPSMSKDNGIENIVKVVKKYPWFLKRDDWWALRYNREDIKRMAGL